MEKNQKLDTLAIVGIRTRGDIIAKRIVELINAIKSDNVKAGTLDGTFYSSDELPHRDISKVPHPFVSESTKLFSGLDYTDNQKILFTHLNHSNPLLNQDSLEFKSLIDKGFKVLNEKQTFPI